MSPLWDNINLPMLGARLLALAVALTVHEFAHAWMANKCGDDTAKRMGRMSLNPFDHYDPIGSTLLLIFGFGWAKPVPVNPMRFRSYRWDSLKVSAAGPISNILLAAIIGLAIRFHLLDWAGTIGALIVTYMLFINLGLAFFNLIPIPPLDGSKILSSLLPIDQSRAYDRVMVRYGGLFILFLFLSPRIFGSFDILGIVIGIPIQLFLRLVTGGSF
jgi:Zn-dependent protease